MANEQNLRPCEYKLSQEEAKKGGLASAESRRKKKMWRELASLMLETPLKDQKGVDAIKSLGIPAETEVTLEMGILYKIIQKAVKGELDAVKMLQDITGNKQPVIQVNANAVNLDEAEKMVEDYFNNEK